MPTASGSEHHARYADITGMRQGLPSAPPCTEKAIEYPSNTDIPLNCL